MRAGVGGVAVRMRDPGRFADVCTVRSVARQAGVHFARRCTSAVGVGSPEDKGARPPQERPFLCACALAPFMAARAGEPSCSPVPLSRSSNPALGCHPRLEARAAVIYRDKGADTMAGQSLGATAPATSLSGASSRRTLHLVPGTTRTRLSHGAFPLGELVASVYSSRRDCDGRVTLALGRNALRLDVSMSPTQARAMARVLAIAAKAAEATQAGKSANGAEGGAA
jgi:hypothetical protein